MRRQRRISKHSSIPSIRVADIRHIDLCLEIRRSRSLIRQRKAHRLNRCLAPNIDHIQINRIRTQCIITEHNLVITCQLLLTADCNPIRVTIRVVYIIRQNHILCGILCIHVLIHIIAIRRSRHNHRSRTANGLRKPNCTTDCTEDIPCHDFKRICARLQRKQITRSNSLTVQYTFNPIGIIVSIRHTRIKIHLYTSRTCIRVNDIILGKITDTPRMNRRCSIVLNVSLNPMTALLSPEVHSIELNPALAQRNILMTDNTILSGLIFSTVHGIHNANRI